MVVPDGPDVVVRAPRRVGRGQGTCPVLPGPFLRSVENPCFGRGRKGFSPAVRTVIVGVMPDVPDGDLRAPRRPGDASGILVGLFWPHRRSVENPTSRHGAKGLVVPQSRGLPRKEGSNGRLSRSRDTRYGTPGPGSRADRNAKTSRHGLLAGDDGASHRRRPSS